MVPPLASGLSRSPGETSRRDGNPASAGEHQAKVESSGPGLVARQGLERKDVKLNVNGSAVSNPGEVRQALVLAAVEVARTGGSSEVLRAALTGPPVTLGESFFFSGNTQHLIGAHNYAAHHCRDSQTPEQPFADAKRNPWFRKSKIKIGLPD